MDRRNGRFRRSGCDESWVRHPSSRRDWHVNGSRARSSPTSRSFDFSLKGDDVSFPRRCTLSDIGVQAWRGNVFVYHVREQSVHRCSCVGSVSPRRLGWLYISLYMITLHVLLRTHHTMHFRMRLQKAPATKKRGIELLNECRTVMVCPPPGDFSFSSFPA